MNDRFKNVGNALSGLRRDGQSVSRIQSHGGLDHLLRARHVSAGEIDLIDDGDDL